jgi:hypothetical protein
VRQLLVRSSTLLKILNRRETLSLTVRHNNAGKDLGVNWSYGCLDDLSASVEVCAR